MFTSKNQSGFTLIEMMVVVAVIAVITTVVAVSYGDAGRQQRNLERQTDLRQLQSAVENYKRKEGVYPDPGCSNNGWSSESNCDEYIAGLWPEYIGSLPTDPNLNTDSVSSAGFSYTTNGSRSAYKLMIRGTVEGEEVTSDHDLAPCSTASGWCSGCDPSSDIYQSSYAIWGGFADGNNSAQVKVNTERVICSL